MTAMARRNEYAGKTVAQYARELRARGFELCIVNCRIGYRRVK